VLDPPDGELNLSPGKCYLQQAAGAYDVQVRHLLAEVAQQLYRCGAVLYLVEKEESLALHRSGTFTQHNGLEDILYFQTTLERLSVRGLLKVQLDEAVESFRKTPDGKRLPNLPSPS